MHNDLNRRRLTIRGQVAGLYKGVVSRLASLLWYTLETDRPKRTIPFDE
jgi:hypothetical protein